MSDNMVQPNEISRILSDRESGSVALLNRLINALEKKLLLTSHDEPAFRTLLKRIQDKLNHFAAIDNFLEELLTNLEKKYTLQRDAFPAKNSMMKK